MQNEYIVNEVFSPLITDSSFEIQHNFLKPEI